MEQLTQSEKIDLGTTEIAKRIRNQLKEQFKNCKFSITSEYYSGGSCITVALMESHNLKVVEDFTNIPEEAIFDYGRRNYTKEQIEQLQNQEQHQLNPYALREDFNATKWCNGVFLTEAGHNLLKEVVKIVDYYNYDNSDSQTDYYDVNFAFHINIGKWDKEFKDGVAQ